MPIIHSIIYDTIIWFEYLSEYHHYCGIIIGLLYQLLPPVKHHKVFQYPRWHSHEKVMHDLKTYSKVRTYDQYPNDEEGAKEYAHAITLHNSVSETKFDPNWKSA